MPKNKINKFEETIKDMSYSELTHSIANSLILSVNQSKYDDLKMDIADIMLKPRTHKPLQNWFISMCDKNKLIELLLFLKLHDFKLVDMNNDIL